MQILHLIMHIVKCECEGEFILRIVGYSEGIIYSYVVVSSEGHGILLARNVHALCTSRYTFL